MADKIMIPKGKPVALKLTPQERKFLLETLIDNDDEVEQKLTSAPPGAQEVMLTMDELDLLAGYVASEANHTEDKKLEKKLDRICERIENLEQLYEEEEE